MEAYKLRMVQWVPSVLPGLIPRAWRVFSARMRISAAVRPSYLPLLILVRVLGDPPRPLKASALERTALSARNFDPGADGAGAVASQSEVSGVAKRWAKPSAKPSGYEAAAGYCARAVCQTKPVSLLLKTRTSV